MQLHRNSIQQLPWSAETVYLNFPKKVSRRAWNLPTLIGRSKTPPRPLREALRIRMEKPGEESGDLFGRPRALGRCGGPTFCSSNKPRKACFPSIPIPISINLHLRPSAAICGHLRIRSLHSLQRSFGRFVSRTFHAEACFPSIPMPISINLHLRPSAAICGHLRPSAAICGPDLSTASSGASDVLRLAHSTPRHAFLRYRFRFRFR